MIRKKRLKVTSGAQQPRAQVGLYGVICKKFCMSLLHDHSDHMAILGPFQR
jgi:hypothetical protein